MKKITLALLLAVLLPLSDHAQFGNMINYLKNSAGLNSSNSIQDVITKAQGLAALFANMPLTTGKIDLAKAALPLLTQALTASKEPTGAAKVLGTLDQVKGLFAQKWNTAPVAPAQVTQANDLMQKFSSALSGIVANEGSVLKNLLTKPQPAK